MWLFQKGCFCVCFFSTSLVFVCFLDLHCICFLQLWQINSFVTLWKPLWEMLGACKALHRCLPISALFHSLLMVLRNPATGCWPSLRSGLPLVVPALPGSQCDSFSMLVSFAPVPTASKSLDLGPCWWLADVWLYYNCYIWYVLNWAHCDYR